MPKLLSKMEISNFFDSLSFRFKILKNSRKSTNLFLARDFNVFNFIQPDELVLSKIFSNFLNSNGSHGQGKAFRDCFFDLLQIPHLKNTPCEVDTESPTTYIEKSQRRIDIILDFGHSAIAIENKPWAGEQECQLEDYAQNLSKNYDGNFYLVYFSGDGSEPSSLSENTKEKLINEGRLFVLSYAIEIKQWLNTCYKECQAEKIRWFVWDLISYIDQNFRHQIGVKE